jgi:uncharacterized protein YtpQ (UPF0354 family)
MRPRVLVASLLFAIAGAFAWQPVAAAETTPAQFTREFVKVLKTVMPNRKMKIVKPLEVHVEKGADGEELTAYLDNAYNQALQDPKLKDQIIEQYARSLVESTVDGPLDPERIVPVVKDKGWLADMARSLAANGGEAPEHVTEELNSELVIVYAEDTPRSIRYFSEAKLEEAGVKRAELRQRATENLMRLLPGIEIHSGELFSMLTAGGDYEASLLVVDDLWKSGDIKVDGAIVVAVPTRDLLLVTGSKNAAGISKLEEVAREAVNKSSYSLTTTLFVYRDGKFEPFRR